MSRTWIPAALAVLLLSGHTAVASSPGSEDDLAVVKRATAGPQEPRAPEPTPPVVTRKSGRDPQWLRLRVQEKGAKRAKVSVNLPFSLVRAVGDDLPVKWDCARRNKGEDRCSIRVSEILKALEAGQELVEIDDEEATIRIWVE